MCDEFPTRSSVHAPLEPSTPVVRPRDTRVGGSAAVSAPMTPAKG
jgi:hypothetical protein